jgi:hypothetical protein
MTQTMFAMAALGLIGCWLGNLRGAQLVEQNQNGRASFWLFVAIVSGGLLVSCLVIGLVLLLNTGGT